VSVQGRAARMLDATTFMADAEVVPGVNTIPVVATDGNGNRRTNNYQVTVPSGATRAFVYDGNGNLLDDGERTYQWDAKNRLIEAKRGADTWQWSYNAFDQRVSEKKNGVVTKRWVWAGVNQPAEERDAAGYVMRRFYPQGEQAGATKFYYTKDHLGSIREVLGANGTMVSSSRYDAWGIRATVGPQDAASFGFTGHLEHKELGLVFTLYRAYDPVTGRWLSRDPIGEDGGINLYGYVANNPINLWDPFGLDVWHINNSKAVQAPGGPYGHGGAIVGQPGGDNFTYHSYAPDGLTEKSFPSLEEAMKYADEQGYDRYSQHQSCEDGDNTAREKAKEWADDKYEPFCHNCQDMVNEMMEAAGVPWVGRSWPNRTFNENSPYGKGKGRPSDFK
jgi:RHS repeat-associated protein